MAAVFMSHPTTVLLQYLSKEDQVRRIGKKSPFEWGRLAMALEILTQMKILQSLPLTDLTIQLESAFQALLVDTGMMDEAERWYEKLDAWRTPRFIAESPIPRTSRAFGASSVAASPEGSLPRTRRLRSLLPERQSPRDPKTSGSEELPDAEERST